MKRLNPKVFHVHMPMYILFVHPTYQIWTPKM